MSLLAPKKQASEDEFMMVVSEPIAKDYVIVLLQLCVFFSHRRWV